jgi:hypothetical protein
MMNHTLTVSRLISDRQIEAWITKADAEICIDICDRLLNQILATLQM